MKITPDDPRLTAYALGELDPAERAAIEAELEKSFALQQAVEEIRETATVLKTKLAEEELPGLAFAQQLKIENQLKEPAGRPATSFWRILFYGGASATAASSSMRFLDLSCRLPQTARILTVVYWSSPGR